LDRERYGTTVNGCFRIGTDAQQIGAIEPPVQLAESVAATFHVDATIGAEKRNRKITAEASMRGAAKRHPFGTNAGVL
jgi:hypothetical protein